MNNNNMTPGAAKLIYELIVKYRNLSKSDMANFALFETKYREYVSNRLKPSTAENFIENYRIIGNFFKVEINKRSGSSFTEKIITFIKEFGSFKERDILNDDKNNLLGLTYLKVTKERMIPTIEVKKNYLIDYVLLHEIHHLFFDLWHNQAPSKYFFYENDDIVKANEYSAEWFSAEKTKRNKLLSDFMADDLENNFKRMERMSPNEIVIEFLPDIFACCILVPQNIRISDYIIKLRFDDTDKKNSLDNIREVAELFHRIISLSDNSGYSPLLWNRVFSTLEHYSFIGLLNL